VIGLIEAGLLDLNAFEGKSFKLDNVLDAVEYSASSQNRVGCPRLFLSLKMDGASESEISVVSDHISIALGIEPFDGYYSFRLTISALKWR
jgi:hypothetical protein